LAFNRALAAQIAAVEAGSDPNEIGLQYHAMSEEELATLDSWHGTDNPKDADIPGVE
jgi:hypothetical protein